MAEGVHAPDICLFMGELSGGGAERVIVTLANGFARRGHSVSLVLARRGGPYLEDVDPAVRIVDLETGSTLAALPALVRYLREVKPQALLTTLHHSAIVATIAARLSRSGVNVFLREANTLSELKPRTARGKLLQAAARVAYRTADGIIGVSSGVTADLRRQIPQAANRTVTIYNPVVGSELDQKAGCPVDHPWFADSETRVLLAAGRLTEQKDFATLITAFGMLDDPSLRLVILGDGEDRAKLSEQIASLRLTDRVDMPGFVTNPFAYMSRAALFVLSSRWEGMPGVLIQAMACGCPVVSTDCPSGPREVLRDGQLGELVPVGDPVALAASIKLQLSRPTDKSSLIERASQFSEEASLDAYLDLLIPRGPGRSPVASGSRPASGIGAGGRFL